MLGLVDGSFGRINCMDKVPLAAKLNMHVDDCPKRVGNMTFVKEVGR